MSILTVIMPVYNSEKYLSQSIESILCQTYGNFELLLIDDGSTDTSPNICDIFASRDKRVRVIHKKNEGICKTRNRGIQEAKGEYIYFMDNDDTISPSTFEITVGLASKYKADIVFFGSEINNIIQNKIKSTQIRNMPFFICADNKNVLNKFTELNSSGLLNCVWDKLYRKDLILKNNVRFDPFYTHGGEDHYFNLTLIRHVNILVNTEDVFYHYFIRDIHSTFRKYNENTFEQTTKTLLLMKNLINTANDTPKNLQSFYEFYCEYIIRAYIVLNHPDCKMKSSDKYRYLVNTFSKDIFDLNFKSDALAAYFKSGKSSLHAIIIIYLIIHKKYKLVLFIHFLVKNVKSKLFRW